MSALQEILEKGYVDPELLEQLGEEQKQILFIKMREEQIRKWRLYEAQVEAENNAAVKSDGSATGRRVQWLTGRDGQVWVWVMGEHPDDLSIEKILERESKEKARRLAENEILQQTLHKTNDLPNVLEREEMALKAELAQIELEKVTSGENDCTDADENKTNTHSPYDDLVDNDSLLQNGSVDSSNSFFSPVGHQPTTSVGNINSDTRNRRVNSPSSFFGQEIYDNLDAMIITPASTNPAPLRPLPSQIRPLHFPDQNSGSPFVQNGQRLNNGPPKQKPPPVPDKPSYLRRTTSSSSNTANQTIQPNSAANTNQLPSLVSKMRVQSMASKQIPPVQSIRSYIPDAEVEKRQSKIFEELREQREQLEREAEAEARQEQKVWEEQEKKAREAEESIRRIAQRAREQHRKCLRTSDSLLPLFQNGAAVSSSAVREALKGLPRPPKPKSQQAIVQWFRASEMAQLGQPPPEWFHGIISRQEAERLLDGRPLGAFLVRVTERIFGYTVSYRALDGTKNFLVERICDGYQFMGTNQLVHSSLSELVAHHSTVPITARGGELLREPVGQTEQQTDYASLFRE